MVGRYQNIAVYSDGINIRYYHDKKQLKVKRYSSSCIYTSGGSRICQRGEGGRTMASARSASLNGGLGAEPPAGSRGRAPGGGSSGQSPPEAESFLYIFTQKSGQKLRI